MTPCNYDLALYERGVSPHALPAARSVSWDFGAGRFCRCKCIDDDELDFASLACIAAIEMKASIGSVLTVRFETSTRRAVEAAEQLRMRFKSQRLARLSRQGFRPRIVPLALADWTVPLIRFKEVDDGFILRTATIDCTAADTRELVNRIRHEGTGYDLEMEKAETVYDVCRIRREVYARIATEFPQLAEEALMQERERFNAQVRRT